MTIEEQLTSIAANERAYLFTAVLAMLLEEYGEITSKVIAEYLNLEDVPTFMEENSLLASPEAMTRYAAQELAKIMGEKA